MQHDHHDPDHHAAAEAPGASAVGVSALWWSAPLRLALAAVLVGVLWLVIAWALR